nr:PKD domain-containing protein [Candidatus Sigynarchaeota archaeon]
WDFGDLSGNSTIRNPIHQFTSIGSHNITLTVVDANLDSRTLTRFDYIIVVSDLFPVANFTANATLIEVNLPVQFTFTGLDGDAPASFEWDFGDGSGNSTLRDPVHQYNAIGNYTVRLFIIDNDGDFDFMERVEYIHVVPEDLQPFSNFTANITIAGRDKPIQFNFTGLVGDAPATFFWNFGDGENSTDQDPIHLYTALGLYTVSLTVQDNDGDVNMTVLIDFINIINLIPVATFSANETIIFEGDYVQFIFDGDPGDVPSFFVWSFGDGGSSNDGNPEYQFLSQGNYTVSLSILDKDFNSDFHSILNYITVLQDLQPVANFSTNATHIIAGQAVQFTFTGSRGNAPAGFEWDFHDGTGFSNEINPVHVFSTNGTYNITLTVTDWDGDADNITITGLIIVDEDLMPSASFIPDKTNLIASQSVAFSYTGTDGNGLASFEWDFGDGSLNSTERDPIHVFATDGSFTIVLTVTDVDGDEDVFEFPVPIVVIADLMPSASFSVNTTTVIVNRGIAFTFNGTLGNEPATITWVFGDGSNASGSTVAHTYASIGDYLVSVTITDVDGDVDQYTFVLTVKPLPDGGGDPVMKFLTENWWVLLIGVVVVIGISGAVASSRKKAKASAATITKGKGKGIPEYAPEKQKLTSEEILAKLRHLFVFHKLSGTCIFYQPFIMKKIDPQLISGFLSAISTFGSEFDKGAKLRVLEYEQFKILMEETEYCRHALLFQGEMDDQMRDIYNNFIYTFDTTYSTQLTSFKGDITPYKGTNLFVKDIFNAKSLLDPDTDFPLAGSKPAKQVEHPVATETRGTALHCPHCNSSWPMTAEQFAMYKGKDIECTNCHKKFVP